MLIRNPNRTTTLNIYAPKYSSKHTQDQWTVLIACYKVEMATPVIIIEFTHAKHLRGGRFCVLRKEAMRYPKVSNGTIECYEIPFDDLQYWQTPDEYLQEVEEIGWL